MTRTYIYRAYVFGFTRRAWVAGLDPDAAVRKVPGWLRRWATVREVEPMEWPRRKR